MNSPDLRARLTKVFKGTGYNPNRDQCGQFTTADNAGGACSKGGKGPDHYSPTRQFSKEEIGLLKGSRISTGSKLAEAMDAATTGYIDVQAIKSTLAKGGKHYVEVELPLSKLDWSSVSSEVSAAMADPSKGAILVGANWEIVDGRHRSLRAKQSGQTTIKAWVPIADAVDILSKVQKGAPNMHSINDRLTRVFKSNGYNPNRDQCGQFTTADNAGGACEVGEENLNRLDGVWLRADELTQEDYEKVLATLSDEMLEIVDKTEKPGAIIGIEDGSYTMNGTVIRANLKNEGMTFKHEYGHHVDHMITTRGKYSAWSASTAKFVHAFEKDRDNAGFMEVPNLLAGKASEFLDRTLFDASGSRKFRDPETIYLEDIADAMSMGLLKHEFGIHGHGRSYFGASMARQYEETFANMFALHGNEEAWKIVESMVPNTARVFEKEMEEIRKRTIKVTQVK